MLSILFICFIFSIHLLFHSVADSSAEAICGAQRGLHDVDCRDEIAGDINAPDSFTEAVSLIQRNALYRKSLVSSPGPDGQPPVNVQTPGEGIPSGQNQSENGTSITRFKDALAPPEERLFNGMKVVRPPDELLITEGCIVGFGALVLFLFCWSEKLSAHPWLRKSRSVAKSLDKLAFEEQILQDFIIESGKPFIVATDGRQSLSYSQLSAFIKSKEVNLAQFGIFCHHRLASMLGDGPETAVAFWAFSWQCAFAPINDKATAEEIEFTLRDLPAKAVLMMQKDIQERGGRGFCANVPILEYVPHPQIAGLFSLTGIGIDIQEVPEMETLGSMGSDSVALVMQTAGTTRKPKLVPLTHGNLIQSCSSIVQLIELHPDDRALNVQPLFHIGGMSNNVIAPVLAHSSVVCGSHFNGQQAYTWIKKYRPTWFYASPTHHILIMGGQNAPEGRVLRCIRSAAAPLLPATAESMERFWGCEVLPSYGMTECTPIAGHQTGKLVCLNTVGPAAAPQVMLDEDTSEILVRGPAVFSGYEVRKHMETNPNEECMKGDWFCTGDRGHVDGNGYLSVTGRFNEMIIRGGLKIEPNVIEEELHDPRIKQQVVFPVAHEELGEVVGIAIVANVEEEDLGSFLTSLKVKANLGNQCMPEVIVKMKKIPRGPAGKLKRAELQEYLGLPKRSLDRQDPIAYTFEDGQLIELDVEEDDTSILDALYFMRFQGGGVLPPEDQNVILATSVVAAFMQVCCQAQFFLQLPGHSYVMPAFTTALGGSIRGGFDWTVQCFMACSSLLLCNEPFSMARVICLFLVYWLLWWPITPIVNGMSYWVSGAPPGSFFVLTNRRWIVFIMLLSYLLFAGARKLPCPLLQCCALWFLTMYLCIWPVNPLCISNRVPPWAQQAFSTELTEGAYSWCGCLAMYVTVGYYGHAAWRHMKKHPLADNTIFQRRLQVASLFLFPTLLFVLFLGRTAFVAQRNDAIAQITGNGWVFNGYTLILDQLTGLVMMALLSQAVRLPAPWIGRFGRWSLGIYLACNLVYFQPHAYSNFPASFGIMIQKVWILPPLQRAIDACSWFWPLLTIVVIFYSCLQIIIFGLPLHWLYAKLFELLDRTGRAIDSKTRSANSSNFRWPRTSGPIRKSSSCRTTEDSDETT